jgi:tetratricopeptide (TPR) repeat protein
MAAKALEGAAYIANQQLNQLQNAGELYKRSSDYYLAHGSADRAAEALEKAAKAWETIDSAKAIEFYTEALNLIESEDRPRAGTDIFKKAITYATKSLAWDVAIGFSKRLVELYIKLDQKHYLNKIILTTIILCLSKDDVNQAKNMYHNYSSGQFGGSEEARIANTFFEAIEEGNSDLLQSAAQSSAVKFLENEVWFCLVLIKRLQNWHLL